MTGNVYTAVLELLRARSGRVQEFERALDLALELQPADCTHSRLLVEGIKAGSQAITKKSQSVTAQVIVISERLGDELRQWVEDERDHWPKDTAYQEDLARLAVQLSPPRMERS